MNQSNTVELQPILAQWGLKVYHYKKIKDVYWVQTDRGPKNLKLSPLLPKRLLFVHQAVNHLESQGFDKMYPIIPLCNGQSYFCDGRFAYTLFDWIEGRQCNFQKIHELTGSTRVLAEFHHKSQGFNPPEYSNMRNRLGKCMQHFEEYYLDLLEYKNLARGMAEDTFARIYLANVDFFLPLAEKAINRLHNTAYTELVDRARETRPFCHGDPAARNFILTPANAIFMIDFDSCRLDLPIMDLIKFTRRVMKKYRWDFKVAKSLIESYHQENTLTLSELQVMKAVFYFPQKFWRMSTRYFHQHGRHTPERALQKFQKYLRNKLAFAQFQHDFETYQLAGGKDDK